MIGNPFVQGMKASTRLEEKSLLPFVTVDCRCCIAAIGVFVFVVGMNKELGFATRDGIGDLYGKMIQLVVVVAFVLIQGPWFLKVDDGHDGDFLFFSLRQNKMSRPWRTIRQGSFVLPNHYQHEHNVRCG